MRKNRFLNFTLKIGLTFLSFLLIQTFCLVKPKNTFALVIDHTFVNLYESIPLSYKQAATNLSIMVRHASIGEGIHNSLLQLAQRSGLNIDRWSFQMRGNPDFSTKLSDFVSQVSSQPNYDAYTYKYCFIDYPGFTYYGGSPEEAFGEMLAAYQNLERSYPGKLFIWWTLPPTQVESFEFGSRLNDLIRNYARQNNKILFDIADIVSHDPSGNRITVNGREVAWSNYCSESPPNISCHPSDAIVRNDVTYDYQGMSRISKSFWTMMAILAGFSPPGTSPSPTITPTPRLTNTPTLRPTATVTPTPILTLTPTATNTPSPTATLTITQSLLRGDANEDGVVDGIDYVIWLNHYDGITQRGHLDGDFNNDTKVDGIDYVIWLSNYSF